jgi:hypothetical protein
MHLIGCFIRSLIVETASFVGVAINPLNAELNPICHLLALLRCATIVVVSRLRVNGHITVLRTCSSLLNIIGIRPEK